MTFIEHLSELRLRLIYMLLAVGVSALAVFIYRHQLLVYLEKPISHLYYYSPGEAFFTEIKLACFGGAFLALPVLLHQLWLFISPALYANEQRYLYFALLLSYLFLLLAIIFLYNYLPFIIHFCFRFALEQTRPAISYAQYLTFVGKVILLLGLAFEMPLAIYLLTRFRIITPAILFRKQAYALLILVSLAALLTPPDLTSLALLSVPLILLYEISILFSWLASRQLKEYAG